MNLVIPMAGRGSRFSDTGKPEYMRPKPLIDVSGEPMIRTVLRCINQGFDGVNRVVFLPLAEHCEKYLLNYWLPILAHDTFHTFCSAAQVISVDKVTQGPACTVLLARGFINNNDQLLIANSDLYAEFNTVPFAHADPDVQVFTFIGEGPHYSYSDAYTDDGGYRICEVYVKGALRGRHAHTGVYWFRRGSDFVRCADALIARGERTNGEFYVDAVIGEAVRQKLIVRSIPVKRFASLGTPEDLELFLKSEQRLPAVCVAGTVPNPGSGTEASHE